MSIPEQTISPADAPCVAEEDFAKVVPGCGHFALRRLRPEEDAAVVHDWVTRPYAHYWGMQGKLVDGVRSAYREIADSADFEAYLGFFEGEPAFVLETYHPEAEPVGEHYPVAPGDRGMHILVAPPRRHIHEFTWHVFTVIMDFLFSDPSVDRIVVEPDARNEKIHRLNRRAGFEHVREITLPDKTALLGFCTRDRYQAVVGAAKR